MLQGITLVTAHFKFVKIKPRGYKSIIFTLKTTSAAGELRLSDTLLGLLPQEPIGDFAPKLP